MKKINVLISLVLLSQFCLAETTTVKIDNWLKAGSTTVLNPAFNSVERIDGTTFSTSDLLKSLVVNVDHITPISGETVIVGKSSFEWTPFEIPADSIINDSGHENQALLLASYLSVDRWTKGSLNITTNAICEIYLDGKNIKTKKIVSLKEDKITVKLDKGNHSIIVKLLHNEQPLKFQSGFETEIEHAHPVVSLSPRRTLTIKDILNGEKIASAKISPSGKYVLIDYSYVVDETGKSKRYRVLKDLKNNQNVTVFRNQKIGNVQWLPRTDRLSYTTSTKEGTNLYLYDIATAQEVIITENIKDFSSYSWSPTETYIIYSEYIEAEKPGDLKYIYGNEDRLPYFRNRSFLHLIDVNSGNRLPLTTGNLSTSLHDIHPDGTKILFSTTRHDYSEVPFSKQNLYEMDLGTLEPDTVWKDKLYDGYAHYSPAGMKLLVSGPPQCFGEIGMNVTRDKIPNKYDTQLYLFDLTTKKAEALTREFAPAIEDAYWSKTNELFLKVSEGEYINLYNYSFKTKQFKKTALSVDVLNSINYAHHQPVAVYTGSSVSTPQRLFVLDLKKGRSDVIAYPEKERFSQIDFGKNKDFNFTNKKGTTIYGRVYYPPGYDASKKYPVIVNFYGGTSPIERSFGGRYPINTWAANGYMVYVLQPSGSTGFGQDFSALHVNGWGSDAIDDIIDGTKAFLKAHPSADSTNVGCIGASYGGYTTMLLQTRTAIFKTAISHAGISSLTSYWGEGYWGYTYNTGAAAYSYPWNRKDIYVDNSPIYNADKFQNSILLLHGTADPNVPVGESLQYYAALKILGKDIEMVLVDGEKHWIIDYKKRNQWHYTITSWFDYRLKNQPEQWKELYPDKNIDQ